MKKLRNALVILCLALCVLGGGGPALAQTSEELYAPIIQKYIKALNEHWDMGVLERNNLYGWLTILGTETTDSYGYAFFDLDDDGSAELLIGDARTPSDQILDLYTLSGGKPKQLALSALRSSYSLVQPNRLHHSVSSMPTESGTLRGLAKLSLKGATLAAENSVLDYYGHYYHSEDTDLALHQTELDKYGTAITKKQCDDQFASLEEDTPRSVTYTPFSRYPSTPAKQESSIALSPSTLTLKQDGTPARVIISGAGDGVLSVSSSKTEVASASIVGGVMTVTPREPGTTTLTVRRSETDLFTSCQITMDVTVETAPSGSGSDPANPKIVYGKDTFRFINTSPDFFATDPKTYLVTGAYQECLIDGMSASETAKVLSDLDDLWGGSCFGMASVLALVKSGDLDVGFFQPGATNVHDIELPRSNRNVRNLINYYQELQSVGDVNREVVASVDWEDETPNNRNLVRAVQSSDYPVVFGIYEYDNGAYAGAHALLAYGCEETNDGYRLAVWDPNNKETPNTLLVSKDFTTSSFQHGYDAAGQGIFITFTLKADGVLSTYRNLERGLKGMGYSDGASTMATQTRAQQGFKLETNYDSFVVRGPSGQSATVVHGARVSGDLSVSHGFYLNSPGSELNIQFDLPALATGTSYSVEPTSSQGTYRTSVLDGDGSGFYSAVEANADGTFTIGADGSMDSKLERTAQQSVAVTTDRAATTWCTVEAEGSARSLSVAPEDTKNTRIETDADASLKVSVRKLNDGTTLDVRGRDLLVSEPSTGTVRVSGGTSDVTGHFGGGSVQPSPSPDGAVPIHRLFNPYTAEHLYTPSETEARGLISGGWNDEHIAWNAPASGTAVYRLYNRYIDDHLYTTDQNEVRVLTGQGWQLDYDGSPIFYSGGTVSVYRLYNRYNGRHVITQDLNEYDTLARLGWDKEGVKLYGVPNETSTTPDSKPGPAPDPDPNPEPTPIPDPEPEPEPTIPLTGLSVNPKSLDLKVGELSRLSVTYAPVNATDKTVTWASSDASVATVGQDGTVKAVAAGTATVTVTSADGAHSARCTVTVQRPVDTWGVQISAKSLVLKVGDSSRLTASGNLEDGTPITSFTWTSLHPEIATVTQDGLVTGVMPGTTPVTVSGGGYLAYCEVTVRSTSTVPDPQTKIPVAISYRSGNGFGTPKVTTDKTSYSASGASSVQVIGTFTMPEPYKSSSHGYVGWIGRLEHNEWVDVSEFYLDGGYATATIQLPVADLPKGSNHFSLSLFPANNFATGGSLCDHDFYVTVT